MTALQLVAMFATFAIQAVTVGLWFAWRIRNDSTSAGGADAASGDRLVGALLWIAALCIAGGLCVTGVLAYRYCMGGA
ncbi:hypothetical protein [Ralstonia mannitolilytica]|uniref:hypothetical protein n=1 Tax=Ralstonia mannitolilytica TaxID=105219 RepID=UPI0028F66C4B|nr:hypothetical protein [Ralstonia mannitolilytica]CAJ0743883.1 hypothetical protein R76696_04692 [Ralstonia mannitolilytica]